MDKEAYRIITELWKFTKKYIPLATSKEDSVWDGIREESNAIYDSTKDMPEYFREMTSKMILGSIDLLEGIYREENEK
jgi:hypothetical protein